MKCRPDGSPPNGFFRGQYATFLPNFVKISGAGFLHTLANKQTNKQTNSENITFLAEVMNVKPKSLTHISLGLVESKERFKARK